jgi:RNA polymerase sigma-70 factor (sigma-E family)
MKAKEVRVDAEESFREYVGARTAQLSRVAYLLTGDVHLAEDLVQQTLLRVAERWQRVSTADDPDAYVRRMLHNQHVSWWRRTRLRLVLRSEPDERAAPDRSTDVVATVMIRRALARLAQRQRAVLVLRYFEDLTEAQTADVLGCAVGTVKSQARDALGKLRRVAPELIELYGPSARTEVQ